jgi:hypothetical protein
MVLVTFGATLPVNPSDATTVLSAADVWAGLIEKCVAPHKGFVKPIIDCEVTKQTPTEIERYITFEKDFVLREGREKVKERIELIEGYSVSCANSTTEAVAVSTEEGEREDDEWEIGSYQHAAMWL